MKRSSLIPASITLALIAATAAALVPDADAAEGKARLRAKLSGAEGTEVRGIGVSTYLAGSEGRARMVVRVRAKLRPGTELAVVACGDRIGTITLRARRGHKSGGQLTLSTAKGDIVPPCQVADVAEVRGSGLLLRGAYRGHSR